MFASVDTHATGRKPPPRRRSRLVIAFAGVLVAGFSAAGAATGAPAGSAAATATVAKVLNVNDGGGGSLRAAINAANDPARSVDRIEFDIKPLIPIKSVIR